MQDTTGNALVRDPTAPSINAFMVLNELERGLRSHPLLADEERKKRYRDLNAVVKREYEDMLPARSRRPSPTTRAPSLGGAPMYCPPSVKTLARA